MRIAHLVCSFPPYQGGMGNSCFSQAKELALKGHEVVVFTPLYRDEPQTNYPFKVIKLKPIIKYGNAAFLPQIYQYLKDFDVIHLHYPFFGVAEFIKFFKKPVVLQYHMDVVGKGLFKSFFNFHTRFILPKIIRRGDLILCSSYDYIKHSNIVNLYKENPKKFVEIPFGVDLNIFTPQNKDFFLLEKYNLSADEKIILFVGGLDKAHYFKGVENLIKSFSKISSKLLKTSLIIIGEGDLKPYYIKLAKDLGIANKIIFAGKVSNQDLPKYYNLSDIFILPSIDKSEAFGIVLLEAMACAKPSITSDLPGVRMVVDDKKTGLLVKLNNTDDLIEKLLYLLENNEECQKFGLAARKKVEEKYSWGKITSQLENIYFTLIK